jgi:hypothetical protein
MDYWLYPLRYGDTLSNHDWIELHVNRLLTSRFVAYCVSEDRRADGFTALLLWSEAIRQDPAGTLPDDDVELAQLAKFGADVAGWRAARPGALYGWQPCDVEGLDDGVPRRLGHRFLTDVVARMHVRKKGRDQQREANKQAQVRSRVRRKLAAMRVGKALQESDQVVHAVAEYLMHGDLYITDDNVRVALEEAAGVPRVVGLEVSR